MMHLPVLAVIGVIATVAMLVSSLMLCAKKNSEGSDEVRVSMLMSMTCVVSRFF
jgi:hypothetical protein